MGRWLWLVLVVLAATAQAEGEFDRSRLYGGGGMGVTEVPGKPEGYSAQQIYGGYQLGFPKVDWGLGVEAGYLNTSQLAWDGLWIAGVGSYRIAPGMELLGRVGLDLGDDLGLLGGVGLSYATERNMEIRIEYQRRTHLQSILLNVVWRPWFFRDYSDSY